MTSRGLAIALWGACVFVAWHVIFDQLVWTAATEFTREQVARHHGGLPVVSIHDGFSPRVPQAALRAGVYTLPVVLTAALSIYLLFRRVR